MYGLGTMLLTSWVLLICWLVPEIGPPICRVDFPGNSTGELSYFGQGLRVLGALCRPSAANTIIDQHQVHSVGPWGI